MRGAKLGLVVVASLIFGLALSVPAWSAGFSDVGTSSVEYEAVQYLVEAKVLNGYSDGTFRPGEPVTRGQAAKIMVLQQGVAPVKTACRFSDVDSVFAAFVEAAAAQGWVGGYPDGYFRPYDTLQRQHMAVILVRGMGWEQQAKAMSSTQMQDLLGRFPDLTQVSAEAGRYVAYAIEKGLINGDAEGRLNPVSGVTRAQAAMMTYRAEMAKMGAVEGLRAHAGHSDRTRVVVDLPLVPVTRTAGRPRPSRSMMVGSMALATRPPIMPPAPRPDSREAVVASEAAAVAAVDRSRRRERGIRAGMRSSVVDGYRPAGVTPRSTAAMNATSESSGIPLRTACMALPRRSVVLLHTTTEVWRVSFSE